MTSTSTLSSNNDSPDVDRTVCHQDTLPDDAWVAAHYPRIHRGAWMLTGDPIEAEDLAQETFVAAIDQWDRFDGRSSHATWLYGILLRLVRRRARSLGRLKRRVQQYVARSHVREPLDPHMHLAQQQWRESVWADVGNLPAPQREAILLRFAEGMTYEQIAETVGCPVGTAKTRVHHGLAKLRSGTEPEKLAPPDNQSFALTASTK